MLITGLLIVSCKPDDSMRASSYLHKANELMTKGVYNEAKLQLDSIHMLFPRLIPVRKAADTLMYKVELLESKRNLLFADRAIPRQKHLVDSLSKGFIYEKDVKFEDEGKYTYKTQAAAGLSRTYLKAYVTESGEMTLMAVHTGAPLGFNKVKVSAGDVFAETFMANGDSRNSFSNGGNSWEMVSFTSSDINGVDAFITHNISAGKVTVTLEGGKRAASFVLAGVDGEAIMHVYYFAKELQNLAMFKKQVVKARQKIGIVCERLKLDPKQQLAELPKH
jgi:hypothetical protein